jgi:lipopolysaccharide/colanic/teichoic acid biosynthesis glycosyltransferase
VAFASAAMIGTLPFYPLIMLAIWLEDRRPYFFVHTRETLGGREFGCIKFRSMRRDAEEIKKKLEIHNKADGPQFFIEKDPRMTKVGHFLRKYQIDEWPQFWNVLRGEMSVVGPRPSPYRENQYCPPWREARLSVKPGVTGLWQVKRTRRAGTDFQEWIKYDIEYVERASFWFDLQIVWLTVLQLIRGVKRS